MEGISEHVAMYLYRGDRERVEQLVRQALSMGLVPKRILDNGLIKGMNNVGSDFKSGKLFVPEVLASARAMHAGMAVLRPLLSDTDAASRGKFVLGTVEGDLHDIGKTLVRLMLEGAGFLVIDLGIDIAPAAFVESVGEHKPQFLGMSALLTTTMTKMDATIRALEEAGLRRPVRVMVGGAPITAAFAEKIGADGYAPDAGSAVDLALQLASPQPAL